MGDGPLPLSGADRDSIAGESDPRAAGGARGQYNRRWSSRALLKNAKGNPRSQSVFMLIHTTRTKLRREDNARPKNKAPNESVFTDVEKFVSALEGKTHESNDFLALFPTGLGKATKSRIGVNLKVGSRRVAIGEMSAFPEVLSPVR